MGLYTEAVKLALRDNHLDLAKDYARKPKDEDQQKKLWLQIAKDMINVKNEKIEKVIQLTNESQILQLDDLLLHLNDDIEISTFSNELRETLQSYHNDIQKLNVSLGCFSDVFRLR